MKRWNGSINKWTTSCHLFSHPRCRCQSVHMRECLGIRSFLWLASCNLNPTFLQTTKVGQTDNKVNTLRILKQWKTNVPLGILWVHWENRVTWFACETTMCCSMLSDTQQIQRHVLKANRMIMFEGCSERKTISYIHRSSGSSSFFSIFWLKSFKIYILCTSNRP